MRNVSQRHRNPALRRPETAGINIDIDGNALIQLFGRDGNQIAEYTVDSITAKGKVNDTQEEIV